MNNINFLPPEYLQRTGQRQRRLRQIVLLAVALAVMGGWFFSRHERLAKLDELARCLESEAITLRAQVEQRAQFETDRAFLRKQIQLQEQVTPPLTYTQIVAALGSALPPTVTLIDLSLADQTVALPTKDGDTGSRRGTAKDAGLPVVKVDLAGLAPSDVAVANLVGNLTEHAMCSDVKLHYSRSRTLDGLTVREFRLEMNVRMDRQYLPRTAQGVTHAP